MKDNEKESKYSLENLMNQAKQKLNIGDTELRDKHADKSSLEEKTKSDESIENLLNQAKQMLKIGATALKAERSEIAPKEEKIKSDKIDPERKFSIVKTWGIIFMSCWIISIFIVGIKLGILLGWLPSIFVSTFLTNLFKKQNNPTK